MSERADTPVVREYRDALRVLSEMNMRLKAQYDIEVAAAETRRKAAMANPGYIAADARFRAAYAAMITEERNAAVARLARERHRPLR